MKKVILFSALFLLIAVTSTSFSQFKMDIGPAFGFNFNLHNGSDLQEGGTGFGIFFAGRSDMSFDRNRNLGVIFGLAFYDGRGGSSSTSGTDPYYGVNYTQDNDVSIAYFQIETLFRYRLNSGLYFFFGPQLGFDETAENHETKNARRLNHDPENRGHLSAPGCAQRSQCRGLARGQKTTRRDREGDPEVRLDAERAQPGEAC